MEGPGLEHNGRMKPIAIGRRTKRAIESEDYEYAETFCVSPRTPLLKTSMQENAWVCGDNTHGQLGVVSGSNVEPCKAVQGPQRWSSLTFGHSHTVAITAEGKVFTWGSNSAGQLGRGHVEASSQPEEVLETSFELDRLGVAAVGAGAAHTIVAAGEALYVWGDNSHGQLGCGATQYSTGSCLHKPTRLRWLDSAVAVTQIACGKYHTMVVTSQSSLYTWGDNSRGQLGHGDDRQKQQPSKVDNFWGIPVKQVAAGNTHSLALTTNGFLFAWGDNSHGQLGLPLNVDEAEEVHKRRSTQGKARARRSLNQLFLDQMIEMGFPKERSELALLETGNNGVEIALEWLMGTAEEKIVHGLQEWADAPDKQHAPSQTATSSPSPRRVVQLRDVQSVAAGAKHTLAVCPKHVYAFGANGSGQLGLGTDVDSPVPNRVRTLDGAAIIQVAAGKSHSLFLSKSGQVYASGSFAHCQYQRDPEVAIPLKHGTQVPLASSTPDSASSAQSSSRYHDQQQHAAAVDAAAAAAASASSNDGNQPMHHCWPVPVVLPAPAAVLRDGVLNTRPVVHSVVARGNCSAFLIRGPNEIVEAQPPTLLAQLTALLGRAEADVRDGLNKPRSEQQSLKAITASIATIFGNATAISAAFGTASGTRLDVELLDIFNMRLLDLYKPGKDGAQGVQPTPREKLIMMESAVREEMKKALSKLADDIQKNVKLLGTNERAQVLLAAIQNPCLMEHAFAKQCLPKLCSAVLAAPPSCQQLLIRWWSTYPGKLLEDRVVKPLQSYTTQELQVTKKLTLAVMNAIKVLAKVEEANMVHMTLPPEAFYNSLISEKMDMQDHYVAWRQSQNADPRSSSSNGPFSFCSFPFLLDAKAKTRLLQVEAKMQMEQTVAESRLEALYSHYKKNRESSDSEIVAPTAKMRIRMEMQRSALERDNRENVKQPRSSAMMRHITRLFRGARASANSPSSSSNPGGASDYGLGTSGRGEPATELERRNMAKDVSHDASIKRAASLQLPPPCGCHVAESHPDMCIVRVRRNHLVEDAMDEISRQFKKDLFKPLRVHFIGEDGIDAGGVKKEFFQLLVTELLCPDYGLLGFYPESRTYWFNRWAGECLSDFKLLGLVVGLAIYNFVLLDFPLPIALYRKMCGLSVGLTDLERFQPTVGKSLRQLLEYNGPGSVEDVFCQTFAIEEDMAGTVQVIELVPGGAEIPVTEENRRDFVDKYVDWVLVKSVEAQYDAFREGFMMLYKGPAITLFSPAEKERLVCGNPNLDFAALKRHAKYEGGYTAETQAVVWLWDIAENIFGMAEKRMFLKFFTGSDRSPIGGLGNLKCLIQRDGPDSHKLPTSHTCFNTLLLPEYSSHDKMLDRVRLAIMNAEGFGLE